MKKIKLDTGITAVALGSGTLRFHPADPNLYVRFQEAVEKLQAVEAEMVAKAADASGETVARLLFDADRQMKELLSWVFGPGNDFDALLDGVNLLAVAANGERVVTNLFAALQEILEAGVERCARQAAGK